MTPLQADELPFLETHVVPLNEKMEEEMFLGLRKTAGVSMQHFKDKFFVEMTEVFAKAIEEQTRHGLLVQENDFIRLTEKGKLLGNEVFQAFLNA